MAAFSKTIRNGIGIVGGGPASLWNAYNWGAFKWGEGTRDIGQNVVHGVGSSFSPTSSVGKAVRHLISEAFSTTSSVGLTFLKYLSGSLTFSGDMASEQLYDAAGYRYTFPDRTTEGESRTTITWTQGPLGSTTWTESSDPSTTWSEQ